MSDIKFSAIREITVSILYRPVYFSVNNLFKEYNYMNVKIINTSKKSSHIGITDSNFKITIPHDNCINYNEVAQCFNCKPGFTLENNFC